MQNLFSRSPWERPSVVSLRGPRMGQTSPNCEPTPEGGQRCADGTYHPPGCPNTPGSGIPAAAPTPGASVPLIVAGVAAAAAAGYALLAGHRHDLGVTPAFESAYPEATMQLNQIADKINAERANDAYYFAKYIEASKRRQDLVFTEGAAQKALAEQERNWNLYHNNPDVYQAAQVSYDQAMSQKGAAAQEMQDARAGINTSAQNIMTYRSNAEAVISQLPPEDQAQAWKLIDPCSFKKTMEGRRLGQYGAVQNGGGYYSWNGYGQDPAQRLLQNAQESMNAPAPQTPQQRLLQNAAAQIGADCYTCAKEGDIRSGVDSATAASLKQQGYRCRKDECAQKGGYGSGSYTGFNGFGNAMNYGSQQASSMVSDINPSYGATSFNAMMGRRYPVVNR